MRLAAASGRSRVGGPHLGGRVAAEAGRAGGVGAVALGGVGGRPPGAARGPRPDRAMHVEVPRPGLGPGGLAPAIMPVGAEVDERHSAVAAALDGYPHLLRRPGGRPSLSRWCCGMLAGAPGYCALLCGRGRATRPIREPFGVSLQRAVRLRRPARCGHLTSPTAWWPSSCWRWLRLRRRRSGKSMRRTPWRGVSVGTCGARVRAIGSKRVFFWLSQPSRLRRPSTPRRARWRPSGRRRCIVKPASRPGGGGATQVG